MNMSYFEELLVTCNIHELFCDSSIVQTINNHQRCFNTESPIWSTKNCKVAD